MPSTIFIETHLTTAATTTTTTTTTTAIINSYFTCTIQAYQPFPTSVFNVYNIGRVSPSNTLGCWIACITLTSRSAVKPIPPAIVEVSVMGFSLHFFPETSKAFFKKQKSESVHLGSIEKLGRKQNWKTLESSIWLWCRIFPLHRIWVTSNQPPTSRSATDSLAFLMATNSPLRTWKALWTSRGVILTLPTTNRTDVFFFRTRGN